MEIWLNGPVPKIPTLLQPVAHALLQAEEDIKKYTQDFSDILLWVQPAGLASVGFHLNHISGVLDRMLTYADSQQLTEEQFRFLKGEGNPEGVEVKLEDLVLAYELKVHKALLYLEHTSIADLTETRLVGRNKLPSTKIGLLFHAAEHIQRHVGQLLVTVKFVKYSYNKSSTS